MSWQLGHPADGSSCVLSHNVANDRSQRRQIVQVLCPCTSRKGDAGGPSVQKLKDSSEGLDNGEGVFSLPKLSKSASSLCWREQPVSLGQSIDKQDFPAQMPPVRRTGGGPKGSGCQVVSTFFRPHLPAGRGRRGEGKMRPPPALPAFPIKDSNGLTAILSGPEPRLSEELERVGQYRPSSSML
jgi:hypothetical protein